MAATTMPALRPLTMGQLLDQAVRIYRRNFLRFIAIIAVMQVPLTLLQAGLSLLTVTGVFDYVRYPSRYEGNLLGLFPPSTLAALAGSLLLNLVGFFLVNGVAAAAVTRAVGDHYLGRPASFLGAFRRIGRSWPRLIGALLLALVLSIGLALWWILVPCLGWFTGFGLLLFLWQVIVPVVAPVVVLERQRAARSLRRAWDLVRRRFWWVAGFAAILFLFNRLIVAGPSSLLNVVFRALILDSRGPQEAFGTLVLQTVVQSLVSLVAGLLYLPLQLTAMTLLYFDLRVRTEGLDLAFLAQGVLGDPAEAADLLAQLPVPGKGHLVTWKEIGYFALISMGASGVFGVLYLALSLLLALLLLFSGAL